MTIARTPNRTIRRPRLRWRGAAVGVAMAVTVCSSRCAGRLDGWIDEGRGPGGSPAFGQMTLFGRVIDLGCELPVALATGAGGVEGVDRHDLLAGITVGVEGDVAED